MTNACQQNGIKHFLYKNENKLIYSQTQKQKKHSNKILCVYYCTTHSMFFFLNTFHIGRYENGGATQKMQQKHMCTH